jgi:hypothetical protein
MALGLSRRGCDFIFLNIGARADTTHWTNSNGFFGNPANFDNGVPDGFDTAVFRRGVGVVYGAGSAWTVGGNLTVGPSKDRKLPWSHRWGVCV